MTVRGVWATSAAREAFSPSERSGAVSAYEEHGPQYFADGAGFAVYHFPGGRSLMAAEREGRVSLFTLEEIHDEQERLGLPRL